MDIFRAASRQDTYEKLGEGGSGDSRYDFNMNSPYLIKGKPSKRNDNGLDYIKENGIKPRIVKLIKEMGLEYARIPSVPGTFEMHTKENAAISKHFI
jgi:hypothetical protein